MAIYETVVILNSLLPPKELDDIIERTQQVITESGGKVRTVDKWGKRRLAYEIQKKQYGFYFAVEFEGVENIPLALQSEYNFNDNVLRYLTYAYDKHKLQAMSQKKKTMETVDTPAPAPAPVAEPTEVVEETVAEALAKTDEPKENEEA
ncbi:MAG: 30S ribosomal protein S6 [Calditrichaeota bacterium]|nr:MAG: 30S ribosomal protein S6 [Calditrichota bacterium]MBL1207477.1 30S ribosomal protein S6 [Calditrichota bacterium]NOG47309.1 30S ribosomal protein S6 [Calditrichota bacterium]